MKLKPVKSFLPLQPSAVGAAPYAALTDHAPAPKRKLQLVERSTLERRPRGLTDKQRETLLGTAAERILEEARDRQCRYLRRFDTIHISGCRTKQQRWNSLASMAEPMLARLDIATMALGWLDEKTGAFRLNRQRGLAEDGCLSESAVSRTLTALEKANYLRRRVRRIFKHGKHWVCRVTIHIRPRFFIDLGLGHQLAEERNWKRKRRDNVLGRLGVQNKQAHIKAVADKNARQASHKRSQREIAKREHEQAEAQRFEKERQRNVAMAAFMQQPEIAALPLLARMKRFALAYPHLV
ncbi:hypothetical protein YA0783_24945 [Pseudomonas corrugata]|uniref:hypothetical protein n=1 Tax=Pseudomonas corrugata TaxID=47879 RepID=UPI0018E6002E|nr:hypothetical protein [Pseudomonas corrugata]MBI6621540.1 hypothetical protein [Pseudomonas corrugata]MBI6694225.1 hypothetical protein [Pseudomonas corrugata]